MVGNRRPLCFEGRFLWHPVPPDGDLSEQFDYLPREVFAALDGHIPRDNAARVDLVVKAYPSRAAAMEAFARATASWAVTLGSNAPKGWDHGGD